jgi:DNA-binding transcriptional ArsR family regulator
MKHDAALSVTYVDRREALGARKAIHADMTLRGLSEAFKMLGDPTRLKICLALSHHELCVTDLAAVALMSESAVSHQLRIMKSMRLVRYRKEGKMTYYMLDDDHIEQLITLGLRHVTEG